jgi:5-methylcytosine-specific restriction enzyme A
MKVDDKDWPNKVPDVLEFLGTHTKIPKEQWYEVMRILTEKLLELNPTLLNQLAKDEKIRGRGRIWLSTKSDSLQNPHKINDNLYFYGYTGAYDVGRYVDKLLKEFKITDRQFKIICSDGSFLPLENAYETPLFENPLKPGQIISNKNLMEIFKVGVEGGMRRSHDTNSLVIISDHTKSLYEDKWINDILHYTGMGKEGNQDIKNAQNRTLAESTFNGVNVYLFEVFREGEYIFHGNVELIGLPYGGRQLDLKNNIRDVILFPLKVKSSQPPIVISKDLIDAKNESRHKYNRKSSIEDLKNRAQTASKPSSKRETTTTTYDRNQDVVDYIKRVAEGICQLCKKPAPFVDKDGDPFLHAHHIIWLKRNGFDSIDNAIALCPNCHAKMHNLDLKEDIEKLTQIAKNYL